MPNSDAHSEIALHCERITKRFGSHTALRDASLQLRAGTIHALVGENGAGKSTLMNIVSGLLRADSGTIQIFGQNDVFSSPLDAVRAGIGMVHQHFLLAEALTVAENVALGLRESAAGWRLHRRGAEDRVAKLAAETGLQVDPKARVADLPVGLRQRVEILKALSRGARILLLDEPTAVLAPPEVETLFTTLRALRAAGRTIAIITHKLDEVFALASEATVLRRGETVFTGALSTVGPAELAEKMIGRTLAEKADIPPPPASTKNVLSLQNVRVGVALNIAALTVAAGEIVGIAGVEGNGQQELADIVSGLLLPDSGTVSFEEGRERVAVIPADRQREGLVLDFTLTENLVLRETPARRVAGFDWVNWSALESSSATVLQQFDVQPPNPALPAGALSGGNQQKVIAARELRREPRVILACNPARGLDVGAAAHIHRRLLDAARKNNAGVLLISSDLDEVLKLADRVCVLYRGKLETLGARGVSKDRIGQAMVGVAS